MSSFLSPPVLSFLLALGVQIIGFIWWAARTASAVTDLSTRISAVESEQRSQDKSIGDMKVTMARLDERTQSIVDGLARVEKRLDRMGAKVE